MRDEEGGEKHGERGRLGLHPRAGRATHLARSRSMACTTFCCSAASSGYSTLISSSIYDTHKKVRARTSTPCAIRRGAQPRVMWQWQWRMPASSTRISTAISSSRPQPGARHQTLTPPAGNKSPAAPRCLPSPRRLPCFRHARCCCFATCLAHALLHLSMPTCEA